MGTWESRDNAIYYYILLFYNVASMIGDLHGHLAQCHASDFVST